MVDRIAGLSEEETILIIKSCRHYVAFVRKQIPAEGGKEGWVLFNDEKVVQAVDVDEMKKFAYVYFFERLADGYGQ